jgi:hypothetical protein
MVGGGLLAFSLLQRARVGEGPGGVRMGWFWRRQSYFALTIYLVHHLVHLWPVWWYGAYGSYAGKHATDRFEGRVMDTPLALGLAVAFVVAFQPVLAFLERHRGRSLEGFMRWISEGIRPSPAAERQAPASRATM